MTRVLITGAKGQLGQALVAAANEKQFDVIACSSSELDITDQTDVHRVISSEKPDVVINAAAYTAVDKAESEPDRASAVNVDGPRYLAESCARHGGRLLHVSTDFVFDGKSHLPYKVDAPTNPLSVYGRTKRDGEVAILEHLPGAATVLRTSWVYSATGTNFLTTMLRLMRERAELGIIMDQVGSPTGAASLARALLALAECPASCGKILHWTDAGIASWYDFACAIREQAISRWPEVDWAQLAPIYTEQYPTPAQRPAFSVLDSRAAQALVGPAPYWRDQLRKQFSAL